ncbi:protein CFAP20DC isoform X2 [Vanacampus margaritifer]
MPRNYRWLFICLFFTSKKSHNAKLLDVKLIGRLSFCPLRCQVGEMFKHNYQGGAGVEVFSGQGKDPVAKWKLFGGQSAIRKEYDKEVKGFVYCLEGNSKTVKMQLPENGKMSLGLLQRFLAIQVNIPQGKDFSIELVITDVGHLKRRLYLSTVHKELSATLWHAKLPLSGVKRNIWTMLFVDLVSFTGELFKAAEFLSLDGITLFASCKVRRIFTVKTEPIVLTNDAMFRRGESVTDQIPRSCQFPPNVCHECQLLNMAVLRNANLKTAQANADCGPDQHPATRSTTSHRSKPQAAPHTASGSRSAAPATLAGRKGGPATNGMEKGEPCNEKTAHLNPTHQQFNAQIGDAEASRLHQAGAPSSLQPHPPKGKVLSKQAFEKRKLRFQSAAPERIQVLLESAHVGLSRRNETREKYSPPSSGLESRQEPLTPKGTIKVLKADECSLNSPGTSSISPAPTPAEPPPGSTRPASSPDPRVRSCWESNDEEPELRLAPQEEVFTYASPPHSPKRGQGRGEPKMEMRGDQVQSPNGTRSEAQPEDDFIGSESDEEKNCTALPHSTLNADCTPDISQCLDPNSELQIQPEDQTAEQASVEDLCPAASEMHLQSPDSEPDENVGMASGYCHSPFDTGQDERCGSGDTEGEHQAVGWNRSVSVSRSCLQEVSLEDPLLEEDNAIQPGDSGDWHLNPARSPEWHGGDEVELQMLASLKREQEEDEYKASGLSASQIHQCNVSMSLSSEDASTWTHISTPANQDHHYQKEMNPLQCSNPREWMDVLSPPHILPPSSKRRSDNTSKHREDLIRGRDKPEIEEETEDEYLNLLYDPCLNCYLDPQTGKYYELA